MICSRLMLKKQKKKVHSRSKIFVSVCPNHWQEIVLLYPQIYFTYHLSGREIKPPRKRTLKWKKSRLIGRNHCFLSSPGKRRFTLSLPREAADIQPSCILWIQLAKLWLLWLYLTRRWLVFLSFLSYLTSLYFQKVFLRLVSFLLLSASILIFQNVPLSCSSHSENPSLALATQFKYFTRASFHLRTLWLGGRSLLPHPHKSSNSKSSHCFSWHSASVKERTESKVC